MRYHFLESLIQSKELAKVGKSFFPLWTQILKSNNYLQGVFRPLSNIVQDGAFCENS